MSQKTRFQNNLAHRQPQALPLDFGSTAVTGIHCSVIEGLRAHYGLPKQPVKVIEPYQMLGEVDEELKTAMGVNTNAVLARKTLFGYENANWKEWRTPWGQRVLMAGDFQSDETDRGIFVYPEGDRSAEPSAHMPRTGYFFDTIVRQGEFDEDAPSLEDNLQEFNPISESDLDYFEKAATEARHPERLTVATFGGTALGDIALVPVPFLKKPRGIRDVEEWYVSLATRPEFVKAIFERQVDLAIANLSKINERCGKLVDVVFLCGTDFGTQHSTFCSEAAFDDLYLPSYRRLNDWIHAHTAWKTFKHSCGAIRPLIPHLLQAGFDILNPVQLSAEGMDAVELKSRFGGDLVFWGGGVDTQKTLPFASPRQVYDEVKGRCEVLAKDGGFMFNSVHNIQAKTPVANVVAMVEAVNDFRGG